MFCKYNSNTGEYEQSTTLIGLWVLIEIWLSNYYI